MNADREAVLLSRAAAAAVSREENGVRDYA